MATGQKFYSLEICSVSALQIISDKLMYIPFWPMVNSENVFCSVASTICRCVWLLLDFGTDVLRAELVCSSFRPLFSDTTTSLRPSELMGRQALLLDRDDKKQ